MPDGLTGGAHPRLLVTADAVGGVWRYAVDLAACLADQGVRTVLAVLGPAPGKAQRDEADAVPGLHLVQTGLPLDWTAGSPAELARATEGLAALAVLTGVRGIHLHAPALVGGVRWPAPVVAVAHSCVATWWQSVRGGELPADFAWRTQACAAGLRAAQAVIAPSAAHAAAVRLAYGDVAVQVVPNGARPAPALPAVPRARAVLTAGRLWDPGKNAAALDRVAAALGAPLRAAGPLRGPEGSVAHLPRLTCLGTLDRPGMTREFAGARVFASMALYEPFGLAVLEAAQAGMRLVLSGIPSFRELWLGAATFVENEAALLPALQAALDAPGDGGARARAARYTAAAMAGATLDIHRSVGALV